MYCSFTLKYIKCNNYTLKCSNYNIHIQSQHVVQVEILQDNKSINNMTRNTVQCPKKVPFAKDLGTSSSGYM